MTTIPLSDLIESEGISMTVTRLLNGAAFERRNKAWGQPGARHFRVTLRAHNRSMTVLFSQGSAHTDNPTAEDVLDCLASDASSAENAPTFAEWCAEFGGTDDGKAMTTFAACKRQTAKLRDFMGSAYETLLWHTERL